MFISTQWNLSVKLLHNKIYSFVILTRTDDHEGIAEESMHMRGTMLMGGRGRRWIQIEKQAEMKKNAKQILSGGSEADDDWMQMSQCLATAKTFLSTAQGAVSEGQISSIKTSSISNNWRIPWLIRKQQIKVIGSRRQEYGQRLHTFVHTQSYIYWVKQSL